MDISKLATKEDIKKAEQSAKVDNKTLRSEFKTETKSIRGEILRVEEKVENLEEEVREFRVETGQKLDKLQNTLDGFVGRVDDLSIDNRVGTHHTRELQLKVEDLEKRVKRIESPKAVV